jgi:hypothetical protein
MVLEERHKRFIQSLFTKGMTLFCVLSIISEGQTSDWTYYPNGDRRRFFFLHTQASSWYIYEAITTKKRLTKNNQSLFGRSFDVHMFNHVEKRHLTTSPFVLEDEDLYDQCLTLIQATKFPTLLESNLQFCMDKLEKYSTGLNYMATMFESGAGSGHMAGGEVGHDTEDDEEGDAPSSQQTTGNKQGPADTQPSKKSSATGKNNSHTTAVVPYQRRKKANAKVRSVITLSESEPEIEQTSSKTVAKKVMPKTSKKRKPSTERFSKKKRAKTPRGPSGYNLYFRQHYNEVSGDHCSKTDTQTALGEMWRRLIIEKKSEADKYDNAAKLVNEHKTVKDHGWSNLDSEVKNDILKEVFQKVGLRFTTSSKEKGVKPPFVETYVRHNDREHYTDDFIEIAMPERRSKLKYTGVSEDVVIVAVVLIEAVHNEEIDLHQFESIMDAIQNWLDKNDKQRVFDIEHMQEVAKQFRGKMGIEYIKIHDAHCEMSRKSAWKSRVGSIEDVADEEEEPEDEEDEEEASGEESD